jgi:poly-beta-1,6-N-acetyl-D-glucosamine synthase
MNPQPCATPRSRLLVISPVFNEARHLGVVAASIAGQTRPPERWIVVDDGSTDETPELLERLRSELSVLQVIALPRDGRRGRDGLAAAREIRAFNTGWRSAAAGGWDVIAKIDGDMELPPDYFERLLDEFADNPRLGVAGGRYVEQVSPRRWQRIGIPDHCVPGALKAYTADCLERIGGVPEILGWDTIDEVYARLYRFETRSFPALIARHHRPTGAAAGVLRGRARHGACAWITHYPAYFAALRSLKQATRKPFGLSGLAFLWGYAAAALRGTPRVPDAAFRSQMRAELRGRVAPHQLRLAWATRTGRTTSA